MLLKYAINKIKRFYSLLVSPGVSWLVLSSLILMAGSCKKFIDVEPPTTSTTEATVYSNDATAAAVLTGIYTNLSNSSFTVCGLNSLSLFTGLYADELQLFNSANPNFIRYYSNSLNSSLPSGYHYWSNIYPIIFVANSAIIGLNNSSTLTPSVKSQLLGEAKFIRAFCYFYLVNLYGDVPYVTGVDYETNTLLSRTPKEEIFQYVITDLKEAEILLSDHFLDASLKNSVDERLRPTKWSAIALLARTYLYTGDFAGAEAEATKIINQPIFNLPTLEIAFKKNSTEAIWQLQPVQTGINTQDARLFVLPESGPDDISFPVYLGDFLMDAFENGDKRKKIWTDSVVAGGKTYYYPYKYKIFNYGDPVTEYSVVLRLAEQYLIRAEARAQQDNLPAAQADLNTTRNRAGLADTLLLSKDDIIKAVMHEKQVELFTEWGHRWLDIKRAGIADAVMNVVAGHKGGTWHTNWQWFPIPLSEIQSAPALKQNEGYQ